MYTAKLESSRFCGGPCRAKWSKLRAKPAAVAPSSPPVGGMPPLPVTSADVCLYDAARSEFTARGVAHTLPAMQALQAAQRLDDPATSDASRSPLSKEFSRLREEALRGAVDVNDPIEAIKARVRAKRAEASAEFDAVSRNGRHR
jgi:hypothetical protein